MSATKRTFQIMAEKQVAAGTADLVRYDAPLLSGYLVRVGDEFAVVDQDYEYVTCLSDFVKTRADAIVQLELCAHYYQKGIESGVNKFKRQIASLFGFATQEHVNSVEQNLSESIDHIAENRNP